MSQAAPIYDFKRVGYEIVIDGKPHRVWIEPSAPDARIGMAGLLPSPRISVEVADATDVVIDLSEVQRFE